MLMASTAACDLAVVGHREQRLVDLDVLAAGFGEQLEIVAQQLAEIGHHPGDVVVVLVIGDLGQHVRPGHGDLDRPARQRRHRLEFVDQAEVDVVVDAAVAGRGRMEHVRIVRRDRLRPGAALEGRDASARNNSAWRWAAHGGCACAGASRRR